MESEMNYWLYKSEPNVYGIDDLKNEPTRTTCWEGVRNYQARNNLQAAKTGDLVFFYHSVVKPPAIAGIAKVVKEAYTDHFAFEPSHKYFDPKSNPEKPRWFMVDIEFVEKFDTPVTLETIKKEPALKEMVLLNNSRLSVQPVSAREWQFILELAKQ